MINYPVELSVDDSHTIKQCNIILTNRCNARCLPCSYWRSKKKYDIKKKVVENLVPYLKRYNINKIMLTGGEPTLHPDFEDIVKYLHGNNTSIILVTNGTTLKCISKEIVNCLDMVILSMDADTPDLYREIRGIDAFDDLLQMPSLLKSLNKNIEVIICMLIQKKNYMRLPRFIRLATKLPIDRISFLVPDITAYFNPELRGGSFGREDLASEKELQSIMLDPDDIISFSKIVKETEKVLEEFPYLKNPTTTDYLSRYVMYFQSFYQDDVELENNICPLPLRHILLTERGELKFCFFMPFKYKFRKGMNPVYNKHLINLRCEYQKSRTMLDTYCKKCMQTLR